MPNPTVETLEKIVKTLGVSLAEYLRIKVYENIRQKDNQNIKFATAINRVDGRTQMPVMECVRKKYGVNYVDMTPLPGLIRFYQPLNIP